MRTKKKKKIIIIAIVLAILVIIGIGTYSLLNHKEEPKPTVEPKKEKYRANKVIDKNKLTFEMVNQESNVVEHTIILNNIEEPEFYDMIIESSTDHPYYIITINDVTEKYYRVYNKDFKKISEDLFDADNHKKTYDAYEVQENGNIKLTSIEWNSEGFYEYDIADDGLVVMKEYTYSEKGEVVSQNSTTYNYITPMSHPFAFNEKTIYVFGNHGEILEKKSIEKTNKDLYVSLICTPEDDDQMIGYNEQSEWIHLGTAGDYAKKYIYNYKTGEFTKEESKCMVE